MLVIFGSSNYGKTDHLPGLFYVKTKFFHLWWLPLLPVRSILYLDDGTETTGAEVGFRWKSVATAWLRTIAGFAIIALTINLITGTVLADAAAPGRLMPMDILGSIGFVALMIGLYYGTFQWSRPGYRRAMKLADEIGFPPEVVQAQFPVESAFEPPSN